MNVRSVLVAGLVLCACGAPDRPGQGEQQAPIVGGTDDSGDPAVVAMLADGWPACSGTLIAPSAVLTAGHCANTLGADAKYEVAFGSDAMHPSHKVRVVQQVLHPQYTGEGKPFDFALLQLTEPVSDVAPVPLGRSGLSASDVGATIRHVGFGISDEAAATGRGTKRTVSYPITEVDPMVVWSNGPGQQTCSGDSGGPGLLTRAGAEELVGVVSDGPSCHEAGWDGRVDAVADWIDQARAGWEPDAGPPDAGPAPAPAHKGGCEGAPSTPTLLGLLLAVLGLRRPRWVATRALPLALLLLSAPAWAGHHHHHEHHSHHVISKALAGAALVDLLANPKHRAYLDSLLTGALAGWRVEPDPSATGAGVQLVPPADRPAPSPAEAAAAETAFRRGWAAGLEEELLPEGLVLDSVKIALAAAVLQHGEDAGAPPDAGVPDAGPPDAGAPDAGPALAQAAPKAPTLLGHCPCCAWLGLGLLLAPWRRRPARRAD